MSRMRYGGNQNGIKLPSSLQKELGLQNGGSRGRGGRGATNTIADRRNKRKAMRNNAGHSRVLDPSGRKQNKLNDKEDSEGDEFDESSSDGHEPVQERHSTRRDQAPAAETRQQRPTSILKRNKRLNTTVHPSLDEDGDSDSDDHDDDDESTRSRASSPGLVLDASSRSFKDRAAQDDAEIAALERRLGVKNSGRKNKGSGVGAGDETLDYLLGGLDDGESESRKRKREGMNWLEEKRRKIQQVSQLDDDDEASEDVSGLEEEDDSDEEGLLDDSEDDEDDFAGFDSDEEEGGDDDRREAPMPVKRVKENPYAPPIASSATTGSVSSTTKTKYVPPALRRLQNPDEEEHLARLKVQTKRILNKLSEDNMISIVSDDVEGLYRNNPRQDVTTVLIDNVISRICDPSALEERDIILNASFVTAIYKIIGTDFGAEALVKLIESFDGQFQEQGMDKQALNLTSFLAYLFILNMVSSHIVFDHVRLLLSSFSESSVELLLRIVRDCGPQLRADDPAALKDIVRMLQDISANMVKNGQKLDVRTGFMIDTIVDLKNNKTRSTNKAASVTGEHITRMRKALGSLNNRNLRATEPLRITREDIANTEKKGRWWLVGASWKGNESPTNSAGQADQQSSERFMDDQSDTEIDFLALSKRYRMNTDIRRSIFVAIMSATDCRDAQTRLLKLRLTNKQEQEIARVVLRCARSEPAYNPYYSLLAKNLCKENKKIRMGFQFGLWDIFRRMGEKDGDDDDDDGDGNEGDEREEVEVHEIANLAKMFAYLIINEHMTLGVLKTLNIGFLREQATMFLEVLFISIMTQPKVDEKKLMRAFLSAAEAPHTVKSLQYFVKKQVRKSDLVSKKDRALVTEGCKIADIALSSIASSTATLDE